MTRLVCISASLRRAAFSNFDEKIWSVKRINANGRIMAETVFDPMRMRSEFRLRKAGL